MNDVRECVSTRIQLTSDGHKPYLVAVEDAFGADIKNYAILQKIYGQEANPENLGRAPRCASGPSRKSSAEIRIPSTSQRLTLKGRI